MHIGKWYHSTAQILFGALPLHANHYYAVSPTGQLNAGAKNQLVIAGFRVLLYVKALAGKLGDDQLTGGVYDAPGAQVAAQGGEVFPGQGDVQVAAFTADGAVEADDLAFFRDGADVDTAGIPHPALGNAANGAEDHPGLNVRFLGKALDGQEQVVTPVEPEAVAPQNALGG